MPLRSLLLCLAVLAIGKRLLPAHSCLLTASEPKDRRDRVSSPFPQCTQPSSFLPPSLFAVTTATLLPFFLVSGIYLPYPLLWYPNWLRNIQMQVMQVNTTNQRNTSNWECQEIYSRNWSESETNCHIHTGSAVNIIASLCVPGTTSFTSCEQHSLTCLVLEWWNIELPSKNSSLGKMQSGDNACPYMAQKKLQ